MRPPTVTRTEVITRLAVVFRGTGFERATLSELSQMAGLQRSSLYHLFPGGKSQMAKEVIEHSNAIFDEAVLSVLATDKPPAERFNAMVDSIRKYYKHGKDGCLLGMFALELPSEEFGDAIRRGFKRWIDLLSQVFADQGFSKEESRMRSREVIAMIQGALVVAKGLGSRQVFEDLVSRLAFDRVRNKTN